MVSVELKTPPLNWISANSHHIGFLPILGKTKIKNHGVMVDIKISEKRIHILLFLEESG